jgi:Sulfatase/Putative metal-binding motif
MFEHPSSRFHWPSAASAFAGTLGAGILDACLVLARSSGGRLVEVLALAAGLYGTAGLLLGTFVGWAVATAAAAVPGGWRALREDRDLDCRVAAALLGVAAAALVMAAGTGTAHGLFVADMASRKLAVIATAGLALAFCPLAALAGLACVRLLARRVRHLPAPRGLGTTGLLLVAFATAGVLAFVAALSRADWRVLDLGPLWSGLVALLLAIGHGIFWYGSAPGKRLRVRLPVRGLRIGMAVAVLLLLGLGSQIAETSPNYAAITDTSWGLRFALKLARHLTDLDHDGYSALFGGGDCDDSRADVYPGAEDIPGDGIDQDCQGGDAKPAVASALSATASTAPARHDAFSGNILIIAIDALRADRLGVAGYGRPPGHSLTPTLDVLAQRGTRFTHVWAQAPNTPRSFPSLVTSRYPSEIAWQKQSLNYSNLLPSNHTFFEPLAAAGLHPIGIFSHFFFTADRGISKGFAEWSDDDAKSIADSNKDIASPRIVPRVIARLRKAAQTGERFVLWTHLFEPHSSYMEHPEFPSSLSGVPGLEEKYDYEIAFADLWAGKIIKTLEETKLDRNTAVVVFGDHGEAWGEHKRYFHGQDLTEEQLRVPLLVVVPGQKPVVIDDEVGLIDLGPTLVDLVGAAALPSFHGRSLLPYIEGKTLPRRPIFSELLPSTATPSHEVTIIDGGQKLTHKISERRWELFDLTADPRQQKNLADQPASRKTLDELRAKLLAFEERRRQD